MAQSRDNRIMALLRSCSDMDADERQAFLEAECGSDTALRDEVLQLLEEDAEKTGAQVLRHPLADSLPPHYKLLGLLGSGGMAEVFLAEDSRLGRRVAIKFLNDTFRRDPERMRRFKQEARAASALNHPNIITIHDIGESDGVQYIVSEFVEGETLGRRIERGKIPVHETVEIAIQIASALETAHKAGIIHRDLKPDNIMLRSDGSVKVVDFGIAKGSPLSGVADAAEETAVSTSPGLILGTPKYMSPEQTRGQALDPRSDIFSFGIVLFEMLTGHSPFGGANVVDVIAGIIGKAPREVSAYTPDTPSELERTIYKALEKNPEHRHANANEILAELQEVRSRLTYDSQLQRRELETVTARHGSGGSYLWLALVLVICVLGVGGWLMFGRGKPGAPVGTLRTVPITSWSSIAAEPVAAASFSPDAKMIAFASTRSGSMEIWVKPTAGGDPVQVTRNGFYNQYPVWSPDGQELAFFSSRGDTRGIWRVSFTGGQERQIVSASPSARPIRWAADKKLYFEDSDELFSLDPANMQRIQLTELVSSGVRARTIGLSADATMIAISVKNDDGWKVRSKSIDSAEFSDVADSKDQIDSIVFHPDDRTIFYTGSSDGVMQVFRAAPGEAPIQISTGSSDQTLQDVSGDGTKILCTSITETSDLWTVDTQSAKQIAVANDQTEEYWAQISPTGKSIAYQSVSQADRPFRGSILVKAIEGDSPLPVAEEGFVPRWSPNGEWIAFLRRTGAGISVWKVRPTGSDATQLAEGQIASPGYLTVPYLEVGTGVLSWSPDSEHIAYIVKTDGVWNIWSIPTSDPGSTRQITRGPEAGESLSSPKWTADSSQMIVASEISSNSTHPREFRLWSFSLGTGEGRILYRSPDPIRSLGMINGDREAVIAVRTGAKDSSPTQAVTAVLSVPLAGGSAHKINTLPNAYFHNIHMSRDGKEIAFVTRADSPSEIWTVPTSGGGPKRVIVENDPKVLISALAWAPDGRSLVFGRQTRTNVLTMLTN